MCVGVALHGAAANVGADGDRAAFERHKAEVQRARNSCKFTGSLKDTAQAERVLQLLNHTGAALTANAACTRLLRSLDPELPDTERWVLLDPTAASMQPSSAAGHGNANEAARLLELERQLEDHRAAASQLTFVRQKLAIDLPNEATYKQISDELKRLGLFVSAAGRPCKDPSELPHARKVELAGQLLDKWDEESQQHLNESALKAVELCCSNSHCNRHEEFKSLCLDCGDGKLLKREVEAKVKQVQEEDNQKMTDRKALHCTLKCSISLQKWEWLLQLTGKTRKWPGKRAVAKTGQDMNDEVDTLFDISNDLPNGWTGAVCDVQKAILAHLSQYEAKHPGMKRLLPKTIKIRYTLDGTNLANNGRSLVVVCIILDLPLISDQSSEACIPIAVLETSESRQAFVETLDEIMKYITESQASGIMFHDHHDFQWTQSYDLSAWWKILELAGIQGDGEYCPWCNCDRSNDFDFDTWRGVEIGSVWRDGCNCITSISPMHSGFCVLHGKLRIIGDTLVQKLAFLAVHFSKQKAFVEYMREHISENFKMEITQKVKENGDTSSKMSCASLLGNKCDKFVSEEHFETICKTCGISNESIQVADNQDGQPQQCRALKDDGCRCTRDRVMALTRSDFCQQHQNMNSRGSPPAKSTNEGSNPQKATVNSNHLNDLVELAEQWRLFYPILKQNTPFYSNDIYVDTGADDDDPEKILRFNEEQVEVRGAEGIPKELMMVDFDEDCDFGPDDDDFFEVMTHPSVKQATTIIDPEHPHHNQTHDMTCMVDKADKEQEIEAAINRWSELWVSLFGDHSVTCYVHIISCHAMTMLKINGNLGQFSNSGLESFHKVIKWMLNKTNRWGGTQEAHIALDLLRNYYKLLVLEIEHTENLDVISRFQHWDKDVMIKAKTCPCESGGSCVWGTDEDELVVPAKRLKNVLKSSIIVTEASTEL